eukprot:gene7014-biopygen9024
MRRLYEVQGSAQPPKKIETQEGELTGVPGSDPLISNATAGTPAKTPGTHRRCPFPADISPRPRHRRYGGPRVRVRRAVADLTYDLARGAVAVHPERLVAAPQRRRTAGTVQVPIHVLAVRIALAHVAAPGGGHVTGAAPAHAHVVAEHVDLQYQDLQKTSSRLRRAGEFL